MLLKPSGFNFNIKQPMSCAVKNAIYCITCQGCGEQYIGETKNLRARVRVHKEHIRHPTYRTLGASEHIASCARYKDPMFTIMPFYKCRTENRFFWGKKHYIYITWSKPRQQGYDYRIDLKFASNNGMDDASKPAKFKVIGCSSFRDMTLQKFSFQKGMSHRDSIFTPWNRAKLEKESLFMPENIFSSTKLYPPSAFP